MLLVLEIFRANLFLATHSETDYIDNLPLLKVSCMSLVKIEKSKRPKQLPWGIPDSNCIILESLPLKNTVCVLLDKYSLYTF
jgi:hypothetical protein